MFFTTNQIEPVERFFEKIKLGSSSQSRSDDDKFKIKQIVSYLEIIDGQIRKLSMKRRIVLLDSGAGNCYLSFLIYYYYTVLMNRDIEIHCIDTNGRLMENARQKAHELSFTEMHFYSCDILDFELNTSVDVAFSLHACDTATDKALYLGLRLNAKCIFSVACCQHSLVKNFRNRTIQGFTGYKAIKSRMIYMVADVMRAKLIEMAGYKVDIFEFTSSRNTDKNLMIRAGKGGTKSYMAAYEEYRHLRNGFGLKPELENLLI